MTQGLEWLFIAWRIVTALLIVLLFYRSTLTKQEDNQLFIDESASSRATEQQQLLAKVNRLGPLVTMAGATSGLMIVVIGMPYAPPREFFGEPGVSNDSNGAMKPCDDRGFEPLASPALQPACTCRVSRVSTHGEAVPA